MQYTELCWREGLPYSERFDDIYYSAGSNETGNGHDHSGKDEFHHVFFAANQLPQRWQQGGDFVIAELGFGSGLNCMLTIAEWLKHLSASGQEKTLHYIAIEKYPLSPAAIAGLLANYPELEAVGHELLADYPPAVEAAHSRVLFGGRVRLHYRFMDVHEALDSNGLQVDCWYLDGFSPAKNPDMWSEDLFRQMAKNSRNRATCSSYSAAGFVRRNLQAAGFAVSRVPGFGRKREMITAVVNNRDQSLWRYHDRPWFCLPQQNTPADLHNREKKACILGGGIAGLTTAWALVQRGWQVELIDRHGSLCAETSSNPAVIIYPRLSVDNDADNAFYITAYCHALYQLKKLQQTTAEPFLYETGLAHYLDAQRIRKIIDKYELSTDFVSIHKQVAGEQSVVDYAGAGVLLPPGLCRALQAACGDSLRITKAEIDSLHYRSGKWHCLAGERPVSSSPVLVLGAGTGINRVMPGSDLPVDIVRGQIVVLNSNRQSNEISRTINSRVHITPAINGRHYLGASYQRGSDDGSISEEDNRYLLDAINRLCSGSFSDTDIDDAWVGFRTIVRDRVPVVGAVADEAFYRQAYADVAKGDARKTYPVARHLPGLYVSAAHGSRGFTTAFLAAEIIATLLNAEPLPVGRKIMDYLNPSRFVMHDLQRG